MLKQHSSSRRSVAAAIGAAAVAIPATCIPIGATMAKGEPGQLASLVKLYFAQVDTFNNTEHPTDAEFDAHAGPYHATLEQMVGVPALTAEDALAAIDWLVKEGADLESEYGYYGDIVTSMVDAVRVSTSRIA